MVIKYVKVNMHRDPDAVGQKWWRHPVVRYLFEATEFTNSQLASLLLESLNELGKEYNMRWDEGVHKTKLEEPGHHENTERARVDFSPYAPGIPTIAVFDNPKSRALIQNLIRVLGAKMEEPWKIDGKNYHVLKQLDTLLSSALLNLVNFVYEWNEGLEVLWDNPDYVLFKHPSIARNWATVLPVSNETGQFLRVTVATKKGTFQEEETKYTLPYLHVDFKRLDEYELIDVDLKGPENVKDETFRDFLRASYEQLKSMFGHTPSATLLECWEERIRPKDLLPPPLPLDLHRPYPDCAKCGSKRTMLTTTRWQYYGFECLDCGVKWKQVRATF